MKWISIDRHIEERLFKILYSWKGTPYMRGQQVKKVGVDCVRFVCGVLDELYNRPFEAIKDLPADSCMENPEGAVKVMLNILRRYDHVKIDLDEGVFVEPGDIVLVGTFRGPGHAMIVGPNQNQLWHCNGKQVVTSPPVFTGKGMDNLFAVFRPSKDNWSK